MGQHAMNGRNGYAVYFFPQAIEALGTAIQPYLQEGPDGPCVQCHEVDTGGAFIELTQNGRNAEGHEVALELMVPSAMVRMIVSIQTDPAFGFGPRERVAAQMPVLGPTASPATAPSQALPVGGEAATPPDDAPSAPPAGEAASPAGVASAVGVAAAGNDDGPGKAGS
ncbi:MAG TPA: hypothetical protein VLK29_01170 [Luteimonas sp.]|nr:hypothetical protein [Luteimonas sp.]